VSAAPLIRTRIAAVDKAAAGHKSVAGDPPPRIANAPRRA